MTTLMDDGGMELSEITDVEQVITQVQQVNSERPRSAWSFYVDLSDPRSPHLVVGLNGDRGVSTFWDGQRSYVPRDGANSEPVDYWLGGHHSQLGEGVEITAEQVLATVREFARTGQRPTCIEWT